MVNCSIGIGSGYRHSVHTPKCVTHVTDSASTPRHRLVRLRTSRGALGLQASPSDSRLRASSDVWLPTRSAFRAAGLSRGTQEPSGVGKGRSVAEVIDSHWISFLGAWKSRLHPVQP